MYDRIFAHSKNNVIGKNGKIPWKIQGEQKQFRELTVENVVVMGITGTGNRGRNRTGLRCGMFLT